MSQKNRENVSSHGKSKNHESSDTAVGRESSDTTVGRKSSYATTVKSKPIVGKSFSTSLTGVPKIKKTTAVFHVSRLHPDTDVNSLITFMSSISSDITCEKLNSKMPEVYSSFKITIPASLTETVMNSEFWPNGVTINKFFRKRLLPPQIS